MSGYPYDNSGAGGYPPQYGAPNNSYPNYPPPPNNYNDNQSCASLYGTPAPMANNYPPAPYDAYGGNQMNNAPYGMGAGNNYPMAPPPMSQPMYNPPPQPYGGYGNQPGGMPSNYPPAPNYGAGGMAPPYGAPMHQQPQGFMPHEQSSMAYASLEQYQGTVFPMPNFNPDADCQALRQAMRGAGTNERALTDLVTNRSNLQRQQIRQQYKTMFGSDLVKELGGELSGNFKEAMMALFDPPAHYDAWSLQEAINFGREGTIREILLTRSNAEIRAITEAFRRLFSKDLEQEINRRIVGKDFKRILVSTIQVHREELNPQQIQQARQMGIESVIDRQRAQQDADSLYKAGAGKMGTDERTFNAIFTQRSYQHLRAVFEEYQRKHRKDMAQVIRSEFSGDTKDAYLVLVTCIRDRPAFFAERIHKAVSGMGTRDSTLIRLIITRSEIDLAQIKQHYQQMYKRSLAQDVGGDTSGDYKRLLLSIIK